MTQKRMYKTIAFALLGLALLFTYQKPLFKSLSHVVPDLWSFTSSFSKDSSSEASLKTLPRLTETLKYVDAAYVDPDRINPSEMLKETLKNLSKSIPEVQAIFPSPNKAILTVNEGRREFATHSTSLMSLRSTVSDILQFVKNHQVTELSDDELETYAIISLLSTLDPHTTFLSKEFYKETMVGTSGEFGGLGIVIGFREKNLTIIAPIEGTPADLAGLKAGDHIRKIEGEATDHMLLSEAVEKMRGPKGTSITITVMRENWKKPKEIKLVRDKIQVVSVESQVLQDRIGYVRVKNFQQDTADSLREHLKQLKKSIKGPMKGLILDLRGNPGGILEQAILVSDIFLDAGTIVSTVGLNKRINQKEYAKTKNTEPNYPLAILIDAGSASASEIVSGALKKRAVLIGQRTFGKGTVQRIFDLPDDAGLKLTIAEYLTQDDISIQSMGILPDIETQALVISDKGFNLFPSEEKFGEASLDRHFENKKAETLKAQEFFRASQVSLRFLEILDEEGWSERSQRLGDSKADKLKKIQSDLEIALASELIKRAADGQKASVLKHAPEVVASFQDKEDDKIQSKLKEYGIAWDTAKASSCKPKMRIQASIVPADKIQAGQEVEITLKAFNESDCEVNQVWAESSSKQYFVDQKEFLFGSMQPRSEVSRSVKVEIPKGFPDALLKVEFDSYAQAKRDKPTAQAKLNFRVDPLSKPKLSYQIQLQEKMKNRKLDPNETLQLKVKVTNHGGTTSEDSALILRNKLSDYLIIEKGRVALEKLGTNETREVSFDLKTVADLASAPDKWHVELQFIDQDFLHVSNIPLELTALHDEAGFLSPKINLANLRQLTTQVQSDKFIELKGSLADDIAVDDYFILVNEDKVFYQRLNPKKPTTLHRFETQIPLEPGENEITIVARDNQQIKTAERFILHRKSDL